MIRQRDKIIEYVARRICRKHASFHVPERSLSKYVDLHWYNYIDDASEALIAIVDFDAGITR